jgi:ABC-type transporter Mla subunit MlaD
MAKDTSNVKAGIFVVVGIILGFVVIVILSDIESLLQGTQQFTVRFALVDGLKGLKEGASVTIGDHPTGAVVAIEDETDDEGRLIGKRAVVEVPANIKLYDNAVVKLNPPPLGGGTTLNIESVGSDASDREEPALLVDERFLFEIKPDGKLRRGLDDPFAHLTDEQLRAQGRKVTSDGQGRWKLGDSWELTSDDVLAGGVETTPMMKDIVQEIGIRDIERRRIRNIIRNVDILVAEFSRDPERYGEIIASVRSATQRADTALEQVQTVLDENRDNVRVAIEKIRNIVRDNEQDVRAAIENIRKIVETNRPVVESALARADETMGYARDVTRRVRDETMDKITEAVDNASVTLAGARTTIKELDGLVTTQRPMLERMIANLRLASDNMKLAAIEIRRAPWRLLYKPEEQEVDTENLYSSARSFLLAADSVETTVATLKRILEAAGPVKDQELQRTVDKLKLSVEKFTEAEQQFFDALGEQSPRSK